MNTIEITRMNGNIPKALPNNDHVSAIVFLSERVDRCNKILLSSAEDCSLENAKKLFGSSLTKETETYKLFLSLIKQFYAMSPSASLWVGAMVSPSEIVKMQRAAGGEIRQMIVVMDDLEAISYSSFVEIAKQLEEENMPLSFILQSIVVDIDELVSDDIELPVCERISIVVAATSEPNYILGYVLGAVSAAAVNESISWVRKFPVPVSEPMICGTPISEINQAVLDVLDQKGFIFLRSYTGLNGYYFNDSRTMADPTSDYNTIESVRTMDKAVRGIRTYLLPELGAPLKLDPETGCLAPDTVKHLETVASQQLTAMEKAGEISGWSVEIDPAQNVLATSTVEFVIKNVPIGVMRKASVKIGYAQSV